MTTSELFMDAVCDNHSPSIYCQFCGRTHFTPDADDFEALAAKADKKPEKYIRYGDGCTIAWGYLDGKQYVYECPCDSGKRYEDWIIAHRMAIAKFLKEWSVERAKQANAEAEILANKIMDRFGVR